MNTETGESVALKIIEKERIKADDFGESLKKEVRNFKVGAFTPKSKASQRGRSEGSTG